MKQYLNLLKEIKSKGTFKPAARENLPGTLSLFGHQMRFNLFEGFPILTTKRVNFKHIITELLWFLKGDTNIKYLVDNGCNIWNEDAYNYYKKLHNNTGSSELTLLTEQEFINRIESPSTTIPNYIFGDCGEQYGKLWRDWKGLNKELSTYKDYYDPDSLMGEYGTFYKSQSVDQISELIEGLQTNPMSRRHILTAWNPTTLNEMALNTCHSFVQFNCRPLTIEEQTKWWDKSYGLRDNFEDEEFINRLKLNDVPKYYLDCQMYQRSADVFLGVPYNISSYALLTNILCKICNMIPGEFIHTFGDVHIYENHMDQVNLQLTRTPDKLPQLVINKDLKYEFDKFGLDKFIDDLNIDDFKLNNYNPQSIIKGKLSTGLK